MKKICNPHKKKFKTRTCILKLLREVARGRTPEVLWPNWLHCNEVVFMGWMILAGRVEHNVGGFVANWCIGACWVERG